MWSRERETACYHNVTAVEYYSSHLARETCIRPCEPAKEKKRKKQRQIKNIVPWNITLHRYHNSWKPQKATKMKKKKRKMKTPGRRRRKKKTADTAQKNIVISWHTLGFAEKTTRCESVNMKPETTKTFDSYYIASLSFRTRDSRKKSSFFSSVLVFSGTAI